MGRAHYSQLIIIYSHIRSTALELDKYSKSNVWPNIKVDNPLMIKQYISDDDLCNSSTQATLVS